MEATITKVKNKWTDDVTDASYTEITALTVMILAGIAWFVHDPQGAWHQLISAFGAF